MALAGRQQLWAQDSAPARRYGTEGRTGHHGREGGNGDENRDRGGDGNEDENRDGHEDRDGGGNGSGNGDESRDGGGRGRELGNVQSGNRSRPEDARGGATPTSNYKPKLQEPTPQLDRRIMQWIRSQGREARDMIGKGGGEAKERKKPQKRFRRVVEKGGDLGGRRKKRRQESIGSVDVGPGHLKNRKEETQGAQGLSKSCRESVSPLSGLIRGFRIKYH